MSQAWYIVQTKPAHEGLVSQRWHEAGLEAFFPRVKKMVRGAVRPIERTAPLFPSYVFVHIDLEGEKNYRIVRFTRGVRRVLGVGDVPIPIDVSVVDVIRDRMSDEGVLEQQVLYRRGEQVRILRGPLADLVGVLEKPVTPQGRVRVLLDIYHKSLRAELSCTDIEKA